MKRRYGSIKNINATSQELKGSLSFVWINYVAQWVHNLIKWLSLGGGGFNKTRWHWKRGVFCVCLAGVLPGRSGDKVPIQQPQLAEQNAVDKRHSGQLLQRQMRLELKFLLFHKERHGPSLLTRIKKHTAKRCQMNPRQRCCYTKTK